MQYKFMGKSGLKISEIAFGVQTFGWCADEAVGHAILDAYVEAGGNLLDTSNTYNGGKAEEILGNWLHLRKNRDDLVIATKVFFQVGDGPNDSGLTRKHILNQIDTSLKRLKTDYVDLYQLHCFDESTPLEETLSTLNDLVRIGKVRYIGASNFTGSQMQKALMMSKVNGWESFVSLQPEYSLIVRELEWELLPLCKAEGVGVLPWSPLAGGWLTGKYRRDKAAPENSRVGRKDRWDDDEDQRASEITWNVIDTLVAIAEERGKAPAQIALRWVIQQAGVTAPIMGARTLEQMKSNLGCVGWILGADEMQSLNDVSAIPLPYPYRFIDRYTRKRMVTVKA